NEKAHNVQFYDPRLSSKARGYVQDYTNKVVGSPRLRQHRLKNHTTVIPRAFSIFFKEAYGQYFWFREDHESYLPGWMVHDVNTGNLSLLWQYKSASETESTAVRGRSGWLYGGGGYVAPLSWNGGGSWRAIHNLEFDNWVDKKTRLIVFEINLYNNNLKRFTELRFIIEALSNGFYYTRYQLRCTSFFFKDKPQAQLILALTSVMTVVLLSLAFFMIVQISRDGTAAFFSVFRGYLDVMVLFFGFLTISYFFSRALQYSLFLERLDRSPRDVHTPFVKPFSINEDGLMLFGIFTLFTVLHAMLSIYQAVQYRKFNFMFLKIVGMLIALLFLNVSLSYFLHFSTYIEDRDPVVNLFLHSILRDYHVEGKRKDPNLTLLYIIIFCVIIFLIKFTSACIIFFHLTFTEEKIPSYFVLSRGKIETTSRKSWALSRIAVARLRQARKSLKPEHSEQRATLPQDTLKIKIQKLLPHFG
ncbi:hypothetical protein GE061_015060, partial [Apolygus lucorum]